MKRRRQSLGFIPQRPIDEIWMLRHCPDRDPAGGAWLLEAEELRSCEAEAFRNEDDVVERVEEIVRDYYKKLYHNLQTNKKPFSSDQMDEHERDLLSTYLIRANTLLEEGDPSAAFDELASCLNEFDMNIAPTLMIYEAPVYRLKPTAITPVQMKRQA